MKKLSLILPILLFSCTNNQISVTPSTQPSIISSEVIKKEIDYKQIKKSIEDKMLDHAILGISRDNVGNTYMISNHGKIIKIDNSYNITESKNSKDYSFLTGPIPNLFFNIDSKGNGFFIPIMVVIDSTINDPITGKSRAISRNSIPVYKIENLEITDNYLVKIEDWRFKSYCPSQEDCSDLYINVGGENYSLNEFLKSGKEFIENPDLSLNIVGERESFNSVGNGFYIREDNSMSNLYSFINGVNTKITDIKIPDIYKFKCFLDNSGNGFILYEQDDKTKYHKITNYIINEPKTIDIKLDGSIYYSNDINLDENGNGFIAGNSFLKVNNFILDKKGIPLERSNYGYSNPKDNNIDINGNGFIFFNIFGKVTETGIKYNFTPSISIAKNNNLVTPD